MYLRLTALLLFLNISLPEISAAKGSDENSIPEPTQLSVVVSDVTAEIAVIGSPRTIESDDSTAEIAVIEVVGSTGDPQRGIRVLLKSDSQLENLYLDAGQVSQLKDEFASFEWWYEHGEKCEAIYSCVYGVARCRPSQNVRQAFCPGISSTPEGEQGILVSTPRYTFNFPSIGPSVFVRVFDGAIGELTDEK